MINLLEDYRFTYNELKDVLWEHPEEASFKLFYQEMKLKQRKDVIDYLTFRKHFKIVETKSK